MIHLWHVTFAAGFVCGCVVAAIVVSVHRAYREWRQEREERRNTIWFK